MYSTRLLPSKEAYFVSASPSIVASTSAHFVLVSAFLIPDVGLDDTNHVPLLHDDQQLSENNQQKS